MPVPQNAQAIYTFLTGQGFSPNAAAGILGNIEQESGGNPQEPGGGLIQILGQSGGTLAEQLAATMKYILANGSVKDINLNSPSPQAAALYFSTKYERPNAALANNANREQSAADVAAAAKSGNWPQAAGLTAADPGTVGGGGLGGILGIPQEITTAFSDFDKFISLLMWLAQPSSWVRIGSFFVALILLGFGAYALLHVSSEGPLLKMPSAVPVPV